MTRKAEVEAVARDYSWHPLPIYCTSARVEIDSINHSSTVGPTEAKLSGRLGRTVDRRLNRRRRPLTIL